MANSSSSSSGGIGVFGALGVVFVTLKIVGVEPVASWSWWWVTAPWWGGFALVLAFLAVAFGSVGIFKGFERLTRGRTPRIR